MLIVYVVPKFFKAIPAPLIAIVILTAAAMIGKLDLGTVGDLGSITRTLPAFLIPDVPFQLETLAIIFPYSLALAIVGLLESLLTSSTVDDMTEGQLFFASTNSFVDAFDTSCHGREIVIDFSRAQVWDDSAVGAIDKVVLKYKENNNKVTINGLNVSSQKLLERVAVHHDTNVKLAAQT
ncbi:hypothetical protein J6TS7_44320 [Paenibacillus dendritiformis]|nr:hypothetical protein J6TS7_44320 [Paenibacillus dendritiformis]